MIRSGTRLDSDGEAWATTLAGLAARHRAAHARGDVFRPWARPPVVVRPVDDARGEALTRIEPGRTLVPRAL